MDYKILIADDEPEIRNLLRLYLENENYHVIEAEDGQRALDLLRAEQPALCILDIMMPKIDGYHVLQQIRKESNIPVIILSAKDAGIESGRVYSEKRRQNHTADLCGISHHGTVNEASGQSLYKTADL